MQGSFVWYELLTSDVEAAQAFYEGVIGWQARDSGMAGMDYRLFCVPGHEMGAAGFMALTDEMRARGVPPNWSGYVAVSDLEAICAKIVSLGGTITMPPHDIPGVGRFAVFADPQGAVLCLFTPNPPEGAMPEMPKPPAPGTFGWHELMANDGATIFSFYEAIFGWKKDMAIDMGPMGTYQLFGLEPGQAFGGMMTRPPQAPVPHWAYYICVDAIDAAVARLTAAGGTVINGPMEVPGGSFIVNCRDPQGAYFNLTAGRR